MTTNPLLTPWTGPHGGLPPFDRVRVEDFAPALEAAMAEHLAEVDAIARDPAPPTFENTFAALERAGQALTRVTAVYFVWSSSRSSPEFRALEQTWAPKLAAFRDRITQNAALFARLDAVARAAPGLPLGAEQRRLVHVVHQQFVREGAALPPEQKARLSELNQALAGLFTRFAQNQLGDEESEALVLESEADLAGLSKAFVAAAAAEAEQRGLAGKWVVANTRSSMEPFLTASSRRDLRERGWRLWVRRGDNGGARDNNAVASEILTLRARRAKLLGFPTFAHWQLDATMAKVPDAALRLMRSVWAPAKAQFERDVAEAQALVSAELGGQPLEPWDYRWAAEKLRRAKYDLDVDELKPWLQLERLREAMFWVADRLLGLTFTRLEGVPVFHPDVSVYEVRRRGEPVGLWYFDPYQRPGKQSGAWMSAYRDQQRLVGEVATLVSNNANFVKPGPGDVVTVSWDDARTLFHEFGHALHGLSSRVTFPSLSGTNTLRDFVELPSQFLENYLTTPEVLRFLVDEQGRPIPASLLERLDRAKTFNQGFATAETQASAWVDLQLHLAGETAIDPKAFERQALAELGVPRALVMRHRIPAFGHVFSSDGYAAGYYSYLWAEVLEADAFEAFVERGSPYDAETARRFEEQVLRVGNTVDPAEAFRAFRGRDPSPAALLRRKGFPVPTNGA